MKALEMKTVRLLYPQWQGGNFGLSYPLGSRILAWLAPRSEAQLLEVEVEPYTGAALPMKNGVRGRSAIMRGMRSAKTLLEDNCPDRVITFGGDCLVSQVPFAYLNRRYGGKLGVLWIDAHPDVSTPENFPHAHAMVLGNLLGEGDAEFSAEVGCHIDPGLVMYAGLDDALDYEWEVVNRLGLRRAGSAELSDNSNVVQEWLTEKEIEFLAIHLDLDVLDPRYFRSLLFNMPSGDKIDAAHGKMTLEQVSRIINDVSTRTNVVGFTIAEHMPWDDINLMNMMQSLPFMK